MTALMKQLADDEKLRPAFGFALVNSQQRERAIKLGNKSMLIKIINIVGLVLMG